MLTQLRKLARAKGGMAAVEFGFVAPVLIVMLFGAIEVTNALLAKADASNIASTAADLVAQESTISQANINDDFTALNALIYPFPSAGSKIIITSIIDDGHGGGKVGWSVAQNATPHTTGQAMTVPAGLITTGGSVIYVEVTYSFTSPLNYLISSPISMQNNFYAKPRRVSQISYTG